MYRYSAATAPRTASPRNSRRSLVRAAECAVETPALATSCKIERWVRAVRSRPRSRNRKWSALASRAAGVSAAALAAVLGPALAAEGTSLAPISEADPPEPE